MRATATRTVRRLDSEWAALCTSPVLTRRLRRWACSQQELRFTSAAELVAAARDRRHPDWIVRDRTLAALLALAGSDAMAARVALQILMPQVVSLIDGVPFGDDEDRAAAVVAAAHNQIRLASRRRPTGLVSWQLYRSMRRQVIAEARRHRRTARAELLHDPRSRLLGAGTVEPAELGEIAELAALVRWTADAADVDPAMAELIVLTRAGGVSVESLAERSGMNPQTLRQRRRRGEQRLRRQLGVAAA